MTNVNGMACVTARPFSSPFLGFLFFLVHIKEWFPFNFFKFLYKLFSLISQVPLGLCHWIIIWILLNRTDQCFLPTHKTNGTTPKNHQQSDSVIAHCCSVLLTAKYNKKERLFLKAYWKGSVGTSTLYRPCWNQLQSWNGDVERLALLVQNLRKNPVQLNRAYASVVTAGENASFLQQLAYLSTLPSLSGGTEIIIGHSLSLLILKFAFFYHMSLDLTKTAWQLT